MSSSSSFLRRLKKPTMVDRISSLPDELLCHILSFLRFQQAFATTILSKRWTQLPYSLSVLNFHSQFFKTNETFHQFCRFIDTLVLSPLSPIKTFRLSIYYGPSCDSHIFNSWLEAAIRRRVQEFHLNLNFNGFLHPNLFVSTTLVFLKLKRLQIATDTSCVHLPSLKTLNLTLVSFTNHYNFIKFHSSSPNLEVLHLELVSSCSIYEHDIHRWNGVVELLQHCPKLQSLFIHKLSNSGSSKRWKFPISVVECVSSHLKSCTILNYDGSNYDLGFVTYILRNASLLQDMLLGVANERFSKKHCIIEKLSYCPRISPTCKLFIYDY